MLSEINKLSLFVLYWNYEPHIYTTPAGLNVKPKFYGYHKKPIRYSLTYDPISTNLADPADIWEEIWQKRGNFWHLRGNFLASN